MPYDKLCLYALNDHRKDIFKKVPKHTALPVVLSNLSYNVMTWHIQQMFANYGED